MKESSSIRTVLCQPPKISESIETFLLEEGFQQQEGNFQKFCFSYRIPYDNEAYLFVTVVVTNQEIICGFRLQRGGMTTYLQETKSYRFNNDSHSVNDFKASYQRLLEYIGSQPYLKEILHQI